MARQHHELGKIWNLARTNGVEIPYGDERWKEIPPLPIPSDGEALRGAKKLLRFAGERPSEWKWIVTHGRRYTGGRDGTIYVNPDHGWPELVHQLSHWCFENCRRWCRLKWMRVKPHDRRHATLERRMIKLVIDRGWIDGALKRPEPVKAPPPTRAEERIATIARKVELRDEWIRKRDRAIRAIAKYDRSIAALKRHATTEKRT